MTYVVDKLEQKKLLKRNPCFKDRRITYAALTKAGKELMNDVFPKHKTAIQEICAEIGANEKNILIEQSKKVGYFA